MSDGTGATLHPAQVWQHWYDAAKAAWANALRGDTVHYPGPFGLHHQCLKRFEAARKGPGDTAQAPSSPHELWKQSREATAKAWETAAGAHG